MRISVILIAMGLGLVAACHKDHCELPLTLYCDGPCPTFSQERDSALAAVDTGSFAPQETVIFRCEEPVVGVYTQPSFAATVSYFDSKTEELIAAKHISDAYTTCPGLLFKSLTTTYGRIPTCSQDCALESACKPEGCTYDIPDCSNKEEN